VQLDAWASPAIDTVAEQLRSDKFWSRKLTQPFALHLAILVEPWLSRILHGSKTIESRWSQRKTVPYGAVAVGDVILLKAASGPIRGICEVAETWFFDIETTGLQVIRDRFGEAIGGDEAFWKSVEGSRYVTLVAVREARTLAPIACPKRDRRGWVVLHPRA
jgi:hypothetical protein